MTRLVIRGWTKRMRTSECQWCGKNKMMRMLWESNECFDCYKLNYIDSLQCKIRDSWQRSFPRAHEWKMKKDEKIMAHIEKVEHVIRHKQLAPAKVMTREEFLEIYPDIKSTGDKND